MLLLNESRADYKKDSNNVWIIIITQQNIVNKNTGTVPLPGIRLTVELSSDNVFKQLSTSNSTEKHICMFSRVKHLAAKEALLQTGKS